MWWSSFQASVFKRDEFLLCFDNISIFRIEKNFTYIHIVHRYEKLTKNEHWTNPYGKSNMLDKITEIRKEQKRKKEKLSENKLISLLLLLSLAVNLS